MKTILIKPNSKILYGATEPFSAIEMPLWLLLFSECFQEPFIIDAEAEDYSREDIVKKINEFRPQSVVILATGSHPSAHIQQKEETELIAMDIKYSGFKGDIQTYDSLIFDPIQCGRPKWDRLDVHKYRAHNWHCWGGKKRAPYASVYTSVSCPYTCDFCCIKSFYKTKYQVRPVDDVVQDFRDLYKDYGVTNFKIMDELFVTKSKRVLDISDKLRDIGPALNIWAYARIDTVDKWLLSACKAMGITWLAYGIESGNDEIRQSNMKGSFTKDKIRDIVRMTQDAGINVLGNFMFGFREDTKETMQETLDFAKELNCEYANFYCTVAYPNSPLYNEMKKEGVSLPKKYSEYAQLSPNFRPLPTKTVTAQEVLKFRDNAFNEYFSNVKYLSYIQKRFGPGAPQDVMNMVATKMERK
jgi:anaerobic magnesium-protoporphyrin IX monomethyl ester cyclase